MSFFLPKMKQPTSSLNSDSRSGFTLIELLVVVVIISISIGMVVMNFSPADPDEQIDEEITRLQQLLRFAHQQSVIRAEEYGVRFYQTGYRFMRFDEEKQSWVNLQNDKLLRYRTLPSPMELNLYIEQTPIVLLASAEDDPKPKQKTTEETQLTYNGNIYASQSNENENEIKPQIFLLSSSELTPQFELHIRIPGSKHEKQLEGLPEGKYIRPSADTFN